MTTSDWYASFPWYDFPEMHAATDALWRAFAAEFTARGIANVPAELDRTRPHGTDREGACLFTQTCGYPLFSTARGHFHVLGAPHYAVPDAVAGTHRSYIVVRGDSPARRIGDLRGVRFAINEADSNSGMNLPRRLIAPLARDGRFFETVAITGSHAASAAAVANGEADAAAIDCVTFALLQRHRPHVVAELRTIASTFATPTPPFVTSSQHDDALVATLRDGIVRVLRDPASAEIRTALFLTGMTPCDATAYDRVMAFEHESALLGCAELR